LMFLLFLVLGSLLVDSKETPPRHTSPPPSHHRATRAKSHTLLLTYRTTRNRLQGKTTDTQHLQWTSFKVSPLSVQTRSVQTQPLQTSSDAAARLRDPAAAPPPRIARQPHPHSPDYHPRPHANPANPPRPLPHTAPHPARHRLHPARRRRALHQHESARHAVPRRSLLDQSRAAAGFLGRCRRAGHVGVYPGARGLRRRCTGADCVLGRRVQKVQRRD